MSEDKRIVPLTQEQQDRLHELIGEDLSLPPAAVDELARIAGYDNGESAEAAGVRLGLSVTWNHILVWGGDPK